MWSDTRRRAALGLGLGLALVGGLASVTVAQPRSQLREFMRAKLTHGKDLLEGLTLEDYDLLLRGAKELKQISEDTRWRVSPNPNYLRLSAVFQDQADELAEAARRKNLDAATLAYVDMTVTCVKCHRLVRTSKLIRFDPGASPDGPEAIR